MEDFERYSVVLSRAIIYSVECSFDRDWVLRKIEISLKGNKFRVRSEINVQRWEQIEDTILYADESFYSALKIQSIKFQYWPQIFMHLCNAHTYFFHRSANSSNIFFIKICKQQIKIVIFKFSSQFIFFTMEDCNYFHTQTKINIIIMINMI